MFRRKRSQSRPPGEPSAGPDLQRIYMQVLQSFLVDGPSVSSAPPAPAPAPTGGGPMAPPPVHAPGAAFVGPLTGAEGSIASGSTGGPNLTVNIPGLGSVTPQQMEAARVRADAVIQEALGSADLSHLTPPDVLAAQGRLDGMRATGRLTDKKYAALIEGLAALSGSVPG
jgi:hypothetical protein